MRYLITGADGYIGIGVLKELVKAGHEVIATDIKFRHMQEKGIEYIETNIFEENEPFAKLKKPDVLIHLAWRNGFEHNSPNHMLDLSKHYKFITNMFECGVNHIVVMGSMHEVGYFEGAIDENTPTKPLSLYGVAKNALREALSIYFKNKEVVFQWIRGFYIVKNTEEGCSIFSKIVQAEHEGKSTFPFTTGKNKYDFIDYEEFCNQIALVAQQVHYQGCINCCTGKAVSLADRVEEFIRENNFKISLEYGVFPDREYDSPAIWGENSIIQNIKELYD